VVCFWRRAGPPTWRRFWGLGPRLHPGVRRLGGCRRGSGAHGCSRRRRGNRRRLPLRRLCRPSSPGPSRMTFRCRLAGSRGGCGGGGREGAAAESQAEGSSAHERRGRERDLEPERQHRAQRKPDVHGAVACGASFLVRQGPGPDRFGDVPHGDAGLVAGLWVRRTQTEERSRRSGERFVVAHRSVRRVARAVSGILRTKIHRKPYGTLSSVFQHGTCRASRSLFRSTPRLMRPRGWSCVCRRASRAPSGELTHLGHGTSRVIRAPVNEHGSREDQRPLAASSIGLAMAPGARL